MREKREEREMGKEKLDCDLTDCLRKRVTAQLHLFALAQEFLGPVSSNLESVLAPSHRFENEKERETFDLLVLVFDEKRKK